MFAEIIIPLALPKNYTWTVPDNMKEQVQPGCRVEVNLGKNKKYAGIVKRLHDDKPDFFDPKGIFNPHKKINATFDYSWAHISKS